MYKDIKTELERLLKESREKNKNGFNEWENIREGVYKKLLAFIESKEGQSSMEGIGDYGHETVFDSLTSKHDDHSIPEIVDDNFFEMPDKETEPKFKVGDCIRSKFSKGPGVKIAWVYKGLYVFKNGGYLRVEFQDNWELANDSNTNALDEAANKLYGFYNDKMYIHIFKHGAEWMYQQIINNADEYVVDVDANGLPCINVNNAIPGDTVKTIIVKR